MLYGSLRTKCPFLGLASKAFLRKSGPSLRMYASRCPVMSNVMGVTNAGPSTPPQRPMSCPFHAHDFPCRRDCLSSNGNHCSLDFTNPAVSGLSKVETPVEEVQKPISGAQCPFSHLFEQVGNKDSTSSIDEKSEGVFDYEGFFKGKLDEKKKDNSYRRFKTVGRLSGKYPRAENYYNSPDNTVREMREVIIWCANDYLGMSRHPAVIGKAQEVAGMYGVGAGGTRNISGNGIYHEALEGRLAKLHDKEAALLFTSCYNANDTALEVIGRQIPGLIYFSDAGNHRSMIEGIRHSGAAKKVFRHNDTEHLEELLKEADPKAPKVVAFESVYSMAGTISPLKEMCDIAHKYGALTFVDEVHAVGLYGVSGAGYGEEIGVKEDIDIVSGTLGKAFGVHGGYVAGNRHLIDAVRSYGAGFIFTTSLPPMNVASANTSVLILSGPEGIELRRLHRASVALVKKKLTEAGVPIGVVKSHIISVQVKEAKACQAVCDDLLNEHGIYVQAINYPTVARGDEMLRVTPGPGHTPEMADHFVNALLSVWHKHGLPLQPMSERKVDDGEAVAALIPGQVQA
eukprot:m.308458 g.308458  ORF g.308458 m.308458 type:complete len:570 (+) comp44034_c0_seq1:144-1853(+)